MHAARFRRACTDRTSRTNRRREIAHGSFLVDERAWCDAARPRIEKRRKQEKRERDKAQERVVGRRDSVGHRSCRHTRRRHRVIASCISHVLRDLDCARTWLLVTLSATRCIGRGGSIPFFSFLRWKPHRSKSLLGNVQFAGDWLATLIGASVASNRDHHCQPRVLLAAIRARSIFRLWFRTHLAPAISRRTIVYGSQADPSLQRVVELLGNGNCPSIDGGHPRGGNGPTFVRLYWQVTRGSPTIRIRALRIDRFPDQSALRPPNGLTSTSLAK